MAEPVGPPAQGPPPGPSQGSQGVDANQLVQQVRDAPVADRLTVVVSGFMLVDALLPWNGSELLTGGQIGLTSGIFALLAIFSGVGAGVTVLGRLTKALDLGENGPNIAVGLGAACLGFTAIHFLTRPTLATTGIYLGLACGGFLTYLGLARKKGDPLTALERPRRAKGPKGAKGPLTGPVIMSKVMRVVSIGPIVGSMGAGVAMMPASHSIITAMSTSIAMMVMLTLLRLGDGVLRPVWVVVGGVPPVLRLPAGLIVPLYISISRIQPSAAGLEVESMRTAMFLSVIVVYVLFHGPPRDQQQQQQQQAATNG